MNLEKMMAADAAKKEKFISNPKPGDYWHEMYCPYHLVIAVMGDYVIVIDEKEDLSGNKWRWVGNLKLWSREQLREKSEFAGTPIRQAMLGTVNALRKSLGLSKVK